MKALFLLADQFEDLHLFCLLYRLREEGIAVTLATPTGKAVTGRRGYAAGADMPIREANPSEYDILLIPGGYAPEKLRLREEAVDIARTFMDEARQVVAVGHGVQLLLSAGSVAGRHLTCAAEVRDDVRAVGGSYHDEPVVADGNLLTARGHDELPELCRQLLAWCHSQA